MRRTTPLTAAALLGLALLAPTTAATAAGETCRGEAATIVGTSATLTGTEGRDVIVTGRATDVTALGGDDLVCVVPDGTNYNVLKADAGPGADIVDTTSATLAGYYVDTDLGPGADTLEGGPGGDWVKTGDAVGNTTEVDTVGAGSGDDIVTTSGGADVVDLGSGNDLLELQGARTDPGGLLAAGEGIDTLIVSVSSGPGHVFDMAAGTYRSEGVSATFSSVEGLNLKARSADIVYSGTEGADYLDVETIGPGASAVAAEMLGGDDYLTINRSLLGAGTRFDTGVGEDRLVAARRVADLSLDLKREELRVDGVPFRAAGIENAFLMAPEVRMVGDEQDNTLIVLACTAALTGGHGDDELIYDGDYVFEEYSFICLRSMRMSGGPGEDSLYGSRGRDRLRGDGDRDTIRGEAGDDRILGGTGADRVEAGAGRDDVRGGGGADKLFGDDGNDRLLGEGGRDKADGAAGRDRCVAERERRC